jgi:hypothetical protein
MSHEARRGTLRTAAVCAVAAFCVAACGDDGGASSAPLRWEADNPVAPLAVNVDTVLYGERLTGRVMRIDIDRPGSAPLLIGQVPVDASGEQRGLLGLAVINDRVYGAWVRPDDLRLVVGEVEGSGRLVWVGPPTDVKAIGGHLEVLDGRLLLGLGELVDDPVLAGTLVTLDPAGTETQTPQVVSDGWNNPFAFTVSEGRIVVADNAPSGEPERLNEFELPESTQRAPSAVVLLGGAAYGVCGYLDGEMRRYTLPDDDDPDAVVERRGTAVSTGCRTGATTLGDGRLVVADETGISVVDVAAGG